jgi:hypothetical protein
MSIVKNHLLATMLKNERNYKTAVLLALVQSVESNHMVYLPNAYDMIKHVMNKHQFAGYLSALSNEGKYTPWNDGEDNSYWGQVNA